MERRRRAGLDLDAHDRPQLPAGELFLDGLQEVGRRRFVELQVPAAGDAERVGGRDFAVRVEEVEGGAYQILDGEEAPPVVERNEARQGFRHLDVRVVDGAAGVVAQGDEHRDVAIAHQRERVTGRARQALRCQERKEVLGRPLPQPRLVFRVELRPTHDPETRQRAEGSSLPSEQRAQAHGDGVERLLGPQAVGRRTRPPERDELL